MTLAFARAMAPDTPFLLAAVLSGRRRPRHLPRGHVWIRIADRIAAGLPPAAATLPEGDPGLAGRLLEREEFQALVAASREMLAEPEDVQRRRLIIMARQALERALVLDDAGAALFVLEEETRGRDPAATLADGVCAAQARAPQASPRRRPPRPSGRTGSCPRGPAEHTRADPRSATARRAGATTAAGALAARRRRNLCPKLDRGRNRRRRRPVHGAWAKNGPGRFQHARHPALGDRHPDPGDHPALSVQRALSTAAHAAGRSARRRGGVGGLGGLGFQGSSVSHQARSAPQPSPGGGAS